jgi:hypothetical protein
MAEERWWKAPGKVALTSIETNTVFVLSFVPEEVFPMCFPSLAHVGRFMALYPSTLCLFVL